MFKEFKEFAFKGNVIDMAVGVIIGTAFSKIVTSLVNDVIMPVFGSLTSGKQFANLQLVLNEEQGATILYGNFIQNIVDFLIIAVCVFIFVKFMNKLKPKKEPEPPKPKAPTTEELLTQIRDLLAK
ncbi:MAG: large-conductance mechanosensitive channel protein MscL [Clostridia bacterium]|nr:large-conductance mechanosensitive channel protein MscL [Clostridia bacterium]